MFEQTNLLTPIRMEFDIPNLGRRIVARFEGYIGFGRVITPVQTFPRQLVFYFSNLEPFFKIFSKSRPGKTNLVAGKNPTSVKIHFWKSKGVCGQLFICTGPSEEILSRASAHESSCRSVPSRPSMKHLMFGKNKSIFFWQYIKYLACFKYLAHLNEIVARILSQPKRTSALQLIQTKRLAKSLILDLNF